MKSFFAVLFILFIFLCVISTLLFAQWYSFYLPYWLSTEAGRGVYLVVVVLTLIFEIGVGIFFSCKPLN
jgi:hypothetical protein